MSISNTPIKKLKLKLKIKIPETPRQDHVNKNAESTTTKSSHIDLAPWPFDKEQKGIILRADWNKLVHAVQAIGCQEAEAENQELHKQIQKLLDEREVMLHKYRTMEHEVSKFCRHFTATYGV